MLSMGEYKSIFDGSLYKFDGFWDELKDQPFYLIFQSILIAMLYSL